MQEVIDELLKAEAEAQAAITRAREEAQQAKARIEADYSLKINEAREEARRLILDAVEKTRTALRTEHEAALREAQLKADVLWKDNQKAIAGLIEEVIALVLTPEYEKE
jgi:vacuolar-type H+-ATPase subunit H